MSVTIRDVDTTQPTPPDDLCYFLPEAADIADGPIVQEIARTIAAYDDYLGAPETSPNLYGDLARIALHCALAVQTVPTDAEIEAAIDAMIRESHDVGIRRGLRECGREVAETQEYPSAAQSARANLLRLIAAQREAAVREALEAVRDGHRKDAAEYRKRSTRETAKVNKVLFEGIAEGFERAANVQDRKIDALLAKEAE